MSGERLISARGPRPMDGERPLRAAAAAMESVALVAPVTALEFVGDLLLAGTGPEVAAFRLSGGAAEPAGRRSVLQEASVQGLRAEPRGGGGGAMRVAAFGGRCLAVLAVRPGGALAAAAGGGAARELGARVWEARWAAGGRLALALGGGTVALYEWRGGGRWLRRARCEGGGALRCAVLAGAAGWARLALAAGTAAGAVLLWRAAAAAAPRRRLRGHRGAVLALSYAPTRGLLASASEDRSVRLWAVGELGGGGAASCLLVCYGHAARVGAVALRGPRPVSAGEDGACLEWGAEGGVRRARRGHRGALRALAVRPAGGCVATGGADGGVRLWWPRDGESPVALALGTPQRARAVRLAGPGRVLVLGETGGLVAYEVASGRWEPLLPAEAVGPGAVLATTPLPGTDPDGDALCAVGSAAGRLAVLVLGQPVHVAHAKLFEGTMHGLSWAAHPAGTPGSAAVLLASGPGGELLWLDVGQRPGRAPWLRLAGRLALPPCKQRWLTCATLLPRDGLLCGDRRGSLLLFRCCSAPGTESPDPAACPDGTDCASETETSFLQQKETLALEEPLSVLFGLHGKTGVTSVTCHGGYVYSTGRDGCYRQLRVRAGQLEVLRKRRPCKGLQWVEELRFPPGGDLLVLGFHGDSFVVWSSRAGEALHRVPCGGGHRSWSYSGERAAEAFAYVKQGDVMLYRGARQPCEQHVLLPSLHGRHITCVRRLGAVSLPGRPAVDVFITGSEDTTARVLALDERSRGALPVTTLDDHISSVRALALAGPAQPRADGFSTLLFSAGGRAQIECYRLLLSGDPDAESTVACEITHVASHRLDEYWDRMKNRHKLIKMDPETRYMSLSVVPVPDAEQLPPPCLFLAAACSDASVRVFGLLEAARQLVLVAESFHHQRCVLKVEAFLHGEDGGARSCFLCSAATDGVLAFWDITAALAEATAALCSTEGALQPRAGCPRAAARPAPPPVALGAPLLTVPAHSCGVNSLHVRPAPGGRVLVASGSDDGSIHVCLLEAARAGGAAALRLLRRHAWPCAHAAHVTGVRALRPDLLLSASVDQRLTLWRLGPRGLQPLSSAFFHVPDLAELDCWEAEARGELHYCGVLCGQGLEVLRCPAAAAAVPRPHTLLCATVPAGDCCGEPSPGSADSPGGTGTWQRGCGAPQAEGEGAPEALSSSSVVAGPSCSPCAAPAVQRPGPHAPFP